MTITGDAKTRIVKIDGKTLHPYRSQGIRNHSPDGFSWGYLGSGPAQLALAILLEVVDQEMALKYYQRFKERVIARFPMEEDFTLSYEDLSKEIVLLSSLSY